MRKRVLILIKGLGRGGAEQLLASAAPYLDTDRFQYTVAYVLPQKDQLVGQLREAGLEVLCLAPSSTRGWMGRLRRLVRREKVDLVHSHLPYTGIGARIALPWIPSVYTEHNVWESYRGATRFANMVTLPKEDHVFAVSGHVSRSMRVPSVLDRVLRLPEIETLYHGIDPAAIGGWHRDGIRAELGVPDDAPIVGTIANLRPEKGLDNMIFAADLVRRQVPEVRFVLVGQGPLETRLRRLVRRLGLERTVLLAGYRSDAPRIAAASDVFALSSIHEGLSIALIEAMALGRPAVVTDTGGLPEVLRDGQEGLLVPPADPAALAAGIVALLRDPDMRRRFGDAGRARARAFDIRRAVRRVEEVYEEVIA